MRFIRAIRKLIDKNFWISNIKAAILGLGLIIVVLLLILIFAGRQKNIGAIEAGRQIVALTDNIRNHYKARPDFWGLCTDYIIKERFFPSGMKIVGNNLIGYFDNPVKVGADENGTPVMPTAKNFVISYQGLNQNQCIALASQNYEQKFWLSVASLVIKNNDGSKKFEWGNQEFGLPLTKKTAKRFCSKNNNLVTFSFE